MYSSESLLRSQVVVGKRRAGQHLKKRRRGKEAAHRGGVPAGPRLQAGAYRFQVGQPVALQADDLKSIQILLRRVPLQLRQHAPHKFRPHAVLFVGVGRVILLDEVRRRGRKRFGLHRPLPESR